MSSMAVNDPSVPMPTWSSPQTSMACSRCATTSAIALSSLRDAAIGRILDEVEAQGARLPSEAEWEASVDVMQAAADHGIVVCNVPDYGTHEVSDHALGLMLCLTRKLAHANNLVKRTFAFPAFTTDRIRVNVTNALGAAAAV